MQIFTVTLNNSFTGKTTTRKVTANTGPEAGHKALSNHMMANAWGVCKIVDAQGTEHSQFVR